MGWRELELADSHLTQRKTLQRGRRGTLSKNELPEVREAHQRALATTTVLEEKIEAELVHHLRPTGCPHPFPES